MKYLILLVFIVSCSHTLKEGDRRLKEKEIPEFLKTYQTYKEADFFQKIKKKIIVYEVKYLEQGSEVSVKYDRMGNFLEEERDISFDSLTEKLKQNIQGHLDSFYPDSRIHEVEKRIDSTKKKFIDVEIRHKSSPTKFWELSFDQDGQFIERKVENLEDMETLN